jgi:hypothetical protein
MTKIEFRDKKMNLLEAKTYLEKLSSGDNSGIK